MAVYQAITIPISITYEPDSFSSPKAKTIDSFIDLVFLIDIIINFRTSYVDPLNGEEILDAYIVAVIYMTSIHFWLDILSTVPFAEFFDGGFFL